MPESPESRVESPEPRGLDPELENVQAELDRLRSAVGRLWSRLKRIVDQFEMTADGAIAVPWLPLWSTLPDGELRRHKFGWEADEWKLCEDDDGNVHVVSIRDCYSTPEAAQQAWRERNGG